MFNLSQCLNSKMALLYFQESVRRGLEDKMFDLPLNSFAKQLAQRGISRCFSMANWWLNLMTFQRTAIISVSLSSRTPFLIKTTSFLLFAKMGVSSHNTMSLAKYVFGAGKWTACLSKSSSKSCQGIISWFQRKSFRNMHSASSRPTQANRPEAGYTEILKD